MLEALKRLGLSVGAAILMFIPLWIFLACNAYLEPTTFVEKALMIVLGYVFLGGAQLWLLVIGVTAIATIWYD